VRAPSERIRDAVNSSSSSKASWHHVDPRNLANDVSSQLILHFRRVYATVTRATCARRAPSRLPVMFYKGLAALAYRARRRIMRRRPPPCFGVEMGTFLIFPRQPQRGGRKNEQFPI
jgi:hypothetical protein